MLLHRLDVQVYKRFIIPLKRFLNKSGMYSQWDVWEVRNERRVSERWVPEFVFQLSDLHQVLYFLFLRQDLCDNMANGFCIVYVSLGAFWVNRVNNFVNVNSLFCTSFQKRSYALPFIRFAHVIFGCFAVTVWLLKYIKFYHNL